jgi:hypothetical protein
LTVTNATFSGNVAIEGTHGGGYGGGLYLTGPATVTNCILWGNTAPNGSQIGINDFATAAVSHSDLQGGLAGIFVFPGGILTDAGGNLAADPLFVDVAAGDLHLLPGSPCIDKGDSTAPGLAGITTDLDGLPRFVGAAVDMGAFEFQNTVPALIAVDDSASVQGFHLLTIPVLANDIVPAGSTITITAVSRASHGAVSIGPSGTIRYRPLPGFTGTDHFTYTISDGQGHTATANVTVTVT